MQLRRLGPDGDFRVAPNPRIAAALRGAAIGGAVLLVGFGAYFPISAALSGQFRTVLLGIPLLALVVGAAWLIWSLSRPPTLSVGAGQVSYDALLNHQSMPQSDLALVFRGLTVHQGRYTTWLRSYLFVAKDGKVRVVVPAFWFPDEGITSLAQWLRVPVKGDFTIQIRGRVDVSPK